MRCARWPCVRSAQRAMPATIRRRPITPCHRLQPRAGHGWAQMIIWPPRGSGSRAAPDRNPAGRRKADHSMLPQETKRGEPRGRGKETLPATRAAAPIGASRPWRMVGRRRLLPLMLTAAKRLMPIKTLTSTISQPQTRAARRRRQHWNRRMRPRDCRRALTCRWRRHCDRQYLLAKTDSLRLARRRCTTDLNSPTLAPSQPARVGFTARARPEVGHRTRCQTVLAAVASPGRGTTTGDRRQR